MLVSQPDENASGDIFQYFKSDNAPYGFHHRAKRTWKWLLSSFAGAYD
jgi:hypothetical protein